MSEFHTPKIPLGRRLIVVGAGLFGLFVSTAICAESSQPDYTVEIPSGQREFYVKLYVTEEGVKSILVVGLKEGGAVTITVDGRAPQSVELLATGGLIQARADRAWVMARLKRGLNVIAVVESDGLQIVHVPQTSRWFGASSYDGRKLRFSIDFEQMRKTEGEFPVIVYFGPKNEEFLHFSGKLDYYFGESYASKVTDISGGSGEREAVLAYTASHAADGLRTTTRMTLSKGALEGNFNLRVRQTIHADEEPQWKDNVEFLHVMLSDAYGRDWGDGVPDWVWYRTGQDGAPDAFAGSRTALARMRDYSSRTYPFLSSTGDPEKRSISGAHHTGSAAIMEGSNTVGGWFSKNEVGSCGFVFNRYQANFRQDLRPLISHCGDGADTHFYLFWQDLFQPFRMKKGDELDVEYSLCFVPTEPLFTDIMDLNEADLQLFGDQATQRSPITGWIGTKEALGLVRLDGSAIFLGIGGKQAGGKISIPLDSRKSTMTLYRVSDLGRVAVSRIQKLDDKVDIWPGEFTVLDCGAALFLPGH